MRMRLLIMTDHEEDCLKRNVKMINKSETVTLSDVALRKIYLPVSGCGGFWLVSETFD